MRTTRHARALIVVACVLGCGTEPRRDPVGLPDVDRSLGLGEYSEWSAPINLGPVVNSSANENGPVLSKDGLSLYFGSTRQGGSVGSNDLWVSRRSSVDSPWGVPQNLGAHVNGSGIDAGPDLSRDGRYLYFTSDRAGGSSNDIWVARRADVHDDLAWEPPTMLGAPINGPQYEGGSTIFGHEFYFNRGSVPAAPPAGPPSDIWMSIMYGDRFGEPTPVHELNSAGFDQRPSVRFDGHEIFITSDRAGGVGGADIWISTRQGDGHGWASPWNAGSVINSPFRDQHPAISEDGLALFFTSDRPRADCGPGTIRPTCDLDLYVVTRTRTVPEGAFGAAAPASRGVDR